MQAFMHVPHLSHRTSIKDRPSDREIEVSNYDARMIFICTALIAGWVRQRPNVQYKLCMLRGSRLIKRLSWTHPLMHLIEIISASER